MAANKVSSVERLQGALGLLALLAATALLAFTQTETMVPPWYAWLYGLALIVMSGVTFIAYWIDKRRAKKDGWRISERKLHTMELLGGWPGAIFARMWLRHKTVKAAYRVIFWLIVVCHLAAIAGVLYLTFRSE